MPIYEYQCKACGHQLEAIQKMADPALTDCPECRQAELVKKISAAAFRLKGGGWYETDFKKSGQRNLAGEQDAAKSDAKIDAKSDAKADKVAGEAKSKPKADSPKTPTADKAA